MTISAHPGIGGNVSTTRLIGSSVRMTASSLRLALLLLWALLGALSYGFSRTEGLAYDGGGMPVAYVRELRSSGIDDDLCIEIGVVLAVVALAWGGLRIRRPFGTLDVAAHGALIAVQVACLMALEAGSIRLTIVRDRSWVLAAWLATLCGLATSAALAAGRVARRSASR
jgi:hypothetical protein